jgi:hypothetical protein
MVVITNNKKKGGTKNSTAKMLNSGLAILATNTIPEHTKRGVVAQILFCESSQSVNTKAIIHRFSSNAFIFCGFFF